MIKNLFYVLTILILGSPYSNVFGQVKHKIKFNKSEWFYALTDSTNFPDTIHLIKRLHFKPKFGRKNVNGIMQFEPEDEKAYFGQNHYCNFQFNYRNKLLFYSIKYGMLTGISSPFWKFKSNKNKLTINTKATVYTYRIVKEEIIEIPVMDENGASKAKTKMLTLIKIEGHEKE